MLYAAPPVATQLPKNHAPFSIADVLAATGGRLVHAGREPDAIAVGVSTDSRAVEAANVFVAIVGERFDGHDHVAKAAQQGARVIVSSRALADVGDASVVMVENTTKALGGLARFHRRRWGYGSVGPTSFEGAASSTAEPARRPRRTIVAITGSAGKTTTRHATASLLASLGRRVHSSAGNLNNAIGVPLTLLGLTSEHDVGVVEIGTNSRGEIAHGASISEPDVAVLTLVAEAHTQGIGSVWDVAAEKGDIFASLRRWGTAIANGDDARARAQLPRSPARAYVTYGASPDAAVRLLSRAPEGLRGTRLGIAHGAARIEALVPLLGQAGAYAALAAVAVALALDPSVSPENLARGLSSIGPSEPGRLAALELADGTILIDDAYNANPASMLASIEAASEIARSLDRRLVLVLGAMFELGPESAAQHAKVGDAARASGASIIAVSGEAKLFVQGAEDPKSAVFVSDVDSAMLALESLLRPRDVVLVKASNSVGLGALTAVFKERAVTETMPVESEAQEAAHAFRARLKGSRLVVIGLGKSGASAARLSRRLGAEVVGADSAAMDELSPAARDLASIGVRLAPSGHGEDDLERADIVVISPGVPSFDALVRAEKRGALVIGELELATRLLAPTPAIAITGSNGKSTTTLLVGELLRAAGKTPFVGGNLGDPPSDIVVVPGGPERLAFDALVLEVSSYQAERLPTFRPRSAALLNVSPNHLDRYDDFDAYVRAKGNLFVCQTSADIAVVPASDEICAREARRGRAKILRFGPATDSTADFAFTRTEIVDRTRGRSFPRSSIRLAGDHNALNVCAALALVHDFDLKLGAIAEVLERFAGLAHRIAFVAEVSGVRYYDDSKGTNVGASVAAIRGLSENKVVLVAGGRDKLGAYDALVSALTDRGRGAVLIGEAADRIAKAIGSAVPVVRAASMEEAVVKAYGLAEAGDAVLLSPACSSFDMFRDYAHRGDAFATAVRALENELPAEGE